MNRTIKNTVKAVIYTLLLTTIFTACKEDELLQLPYLFRPVNFTAEMNKTEATFAWAPIDDAVSYTLLVSTDSLNFDHPVLDTTLTELTYKQEFAGKTTFYARVRANAEDSTKNSKFNQIRFVTPAENLFEGYRSGMSAWQSAVIKWRPAANVTTLKLIADDESEKVFALNESQILAGQIDLSELPNSNYKVRIYKGDILRGSVNVVIEGDVYVTEGQDVATIISTATDGQVIVLAPGVVYPLGGSTVRIATSIKIKGANSEVLPVLCMTAGTPTSTSTMLGFADMSVIRSVKFENVDFTGYCDNNSAGTKIGYLFNNNLMTTVSNLSFDNCKIHNFGNTPMRLQGNKSQVIDTLRMTACTVNDIGFSSTYAIINSNSSDFVNNIFFKNCTFYNFKGSLILRTITPPAVATMGTVSVENCTIDKGMQDAGSARYLFDFNNTTINNGISIQNSIIGATGGAKGANGLRKLETVVANIKNLGNYYTSDYVDDPIPAAVVSTSIKSFMTAFNGSSTTLWTDPQNGNFSIQAASFAGKGRAGDLRWY